MFILVLTLQDETLTFGNENAVVKNSENDAFMIERLCSKNATYFNDYV